MHEHSGSLMLLSWAQEEEIVSDRILLLVCVCALNRWTFEDIRKQYRISEATVLHQLATLDRMKLVELLPGNRIRLLVSSNFHWIANGPIQQFFNEKLGKDVFNSRFDRRTEKLVVANAMLTEKSNAVLQKKIDRLLWELELLNREDAALPVSDKTGTTLIMAVREWNYGVFADLKR
jgi:hypothetical protein